MQKIQDSVFSIVKTTNLSPAVFSFLQPSDEFEDKTPLGGILKDTKYGWLALGPKFCVVDLRTGLKVAARTFGASLSNNTTVTCVVELPKPLTENSQQLVISLQCDDIGMICVLHINGSQILRCIQTDVVITELAICDRISDGPFTCFDGLVMAGTKRGEIFAFDLNRTSLIQALKYISQGYEHLVQNESNPTTLSFLPLNAIQRIEEQRELALENNHHLSILLNESSMVDGQYIFRNPDGTVRMKAKRDHIRVTVLQFIPQLGSMAVGFNFGAFQLWNLMTLDLEYTSQVNVECLPVTQFAFQEPCDDPRAFCYLWVVFSVIDRYDEDEFPLAVMYSLTYQGKTMLSDTKCLYQDFSSATIRFQIELSTMEQSPLLGGKCISCHSYSIKSTLGDEGEDSMLNICQLVWECWGEDSSAPMQYGMLLFDLDQWYKDQMPATYNLESNAFMAATWCTELAARGSVTLHARLDPASVCPYSHATRLEEHFYPNSLQYNCICLNTCEALTLRTVGTQRQIVAALEAAGGAALLRPQRLHAAAARAGLTPQHCAGGRSEEDQRRYLLSVALEARLSRFLKRCAHDWATGSHAGVGCTLPFLVDWAWKRALELKENANELTSPLFTSSALPDGNVVRCLEHCVQQLTHLTGLMDAVLTKCCNLVVPDALSEMEEVHAGIGCVSLYFQVVQWFLRVGLLPERPGAAGPLPYPHGHLIDTYNKRRLKLNRLQDNELACSEDGGNKSCSLLYIDQLIEHEFGGDKIHQLWIKGGSECSGLYPPPSLYSLLRLYLVPEIAEEHKHSLVLYMLVDYSVFYNDVRYEAVIRRLMQFPTMFGLSNTAIKATQAFWHLDHRDFDFALDQLQCLTGNTLHEWQHNVVLSSLLAQKKTQAALQYLHVRKPAPVHSNGDPASYGQRLNSHDKISEWQSCCSLYLARGLVYEALEVARSCAQNTPSVQDKTNVLNYFFKGCRNTGNLSKLLQVTLLPFEEDVFVKYLENCNESQTSDLLIMFYLQQARYIEAERYNNKLKKPKSQRNKDMSTSVESVLEMCDREGARDALVEVVCSALPAIAGTVAQCAGQWAEMETHVFAPKPMSVFVQAKSPKNTFTYKSSFIQDTIENASEMWMNRPKMRKGLKRALEIQETPFICTPKVKHTTSVFMDEATSEASPPKRARLSAQTSQTPRANTSVRAGETLGRHMEELLKMPDTQSPVRVYRERAETPHSILKIRRNERDEAVSPVDSRYLGDSDDELLETASSHTHYSDSTNKHLRFTIPTQSESGSTPSPLGGDAGLSQVDGPEDRESDIAAITREKEMDVSSDSYLTTASHATNEMNAVDSPPKKTGSTIQPRKSYKDTVRARLSLSANSSLSEDNTSIESIADIPVTLINPRYSGERRRTTPSPQINPDDKTTKTSDQNLSTRYLDLERSYREIESERNSVLSSDRIRKLDQSTYRESEQNSTLSSRQIKDMEQPSFSVQDMDYKDRSGSVPKRNRNRLSEREADESVGKREMEKLEVPKTPRARRGIRSTGESTPTVKSSVLDTAERPDSPVVTPMRTNRISRSRSRSKTPELSPRSSPLAPILEQPRQERESEPHTTTLVRTLPSRSKSRTPERMDKGVSESPKLEVIKESPTKSSESPTSSPTRRSLRSRSRTPEVEIVPEPVLSSPRSLRSRSKTPEKLMSPKKEHSVRTKKSLSRLVLEQNTFAKTKQTLEILETEINESRTEMAIECTPMKPLKQVPSLMDVTLSPIDKSPSESKKDAKMDLDSSELGLKTLPAFTTLHETYFEKSVLKSYQSSVADDSEATQENVEKYQTIDSTEVVKPLAFTTINETDFNKSVLHSYESSVAETSHTEERTVPIKDKVELPKPFADFASMIETDFEKSVLHSHQSSIVSPDASKAQEDNMSSLITNDSDADLDVKETENQDSAVMKEKEKIVEIVREINELEEGISDDSEQESEGSAVSDQEEAESEEEEDVESSSSEEPSTPETDEEGDESEVISIEDSDSDKSETNTNTESNTLTVDVNTVQDKEVSEKVETSTDPLNQALVSLLTDDNSVEGSDQSMLLNYSEEKDESVTDEKQNEERHVPETPTNVQEEVIEEVTSKVKSKVDESTSAAEIKDIIDTSSPNMEVKEIAQPDITTSEENKSTENEKPQDSEKMEVVIEATENQKNVPEVMDKLTDSCDKNESNDKTKILEDPKPSEVEKPSQTESVDKPSEIEKSEVEASTEVAESGTAPKPTRKRARSTSSNRSSKSEPEATKHSKDADGSSKEKDTTLSVIQETKEIDEDMLKDKTKSKPNEIDSSTAQVSKEVPKTPRTRKRANSNASAKSKTSEAAKGETEKMVEDEEPKTPARRKRSQSNASKDIPEEKTPENSRTNRAKTPTSTEVRRIVTRRVSKEMREKLLDKSNESIESVSLTPKRRSARSNSKNMDDNESVASESSVVSNRSRASEDIEGKPVKKGRKLVLPTKPDLSVIPEVIVEENKEDNVVAGYSGGRKAMLGPEAGGSGRGRRRVSTASRASRASLISEADDRPPSFDVEPIDRISLLDKTDFQARLVRAASESRRTPRPAKIGRRAASIDVAESSELGSPGVLDSPVRGAGRRASFNRAIEALHTPKGRRPSTEVRSPAASPATSEAEAGVTPARRPRRASTHSNTSQGKADAPRRSKKMPVVEEEDKETKK